MDNEIKHCRTAFAILVVFVALSIGLNIYFYDYWYDHEYPHGEKGIWTRTIRFSQDWYGINDYVNFGKHCYEFGDFDVKSKVFDELDQWNLSYNVTFDDDPYNPSTTIKITDKREPCFDVVFHTYDAMMECSDDTYKQKVIDSLNIGATLSSSK